MSARQAIVGAFATAAIIAAAAVLSAWPAYRALPPETGVVKLSISHGGQRTCREMTEAERAKLPPNMRRTEVCERRRQPVYLELEIDGTGALARSFPPSGIAGDGPSRVYETFPLPAGEHSVAIRLRDGATTAEFSAAATRTFVLAPAQSFVIDYDPQAGQFIFD